MNYLRKKYLSQDEYGNNSNLPNNRSSSHHSYSAQRSRSHSKISHHNIPNQHHNNPQINLSDRIDGQSKKYKDLSSQNNNLELNNDYQRISQIENNQFHRKSKSFSSSERNYENNIDQSPEQISQENERPSDRQRHNQLISSQIPDSQIRPRVAPPVELSSSREQRLSIEKNEIQNSNTDRKNIRNSKIEENQDQTDNQKNYGVGSLHEKSQSPVKRGQTPPSDDDALVVQPPELMIGGRMKSASLSGSVPGERRGHITKQGTTGMNDETGGMLGDGNDGDGLDNGQSQGREGSLSDEGGEYRPASVNDASAGKKSWEAPPLSPGAHSISDPTSAAAQVASGRDWFASRSNREKNKAGNNL
ncbi:MAG: hypothetical protein EZS28_032132 [Streblomastix strix]|uniref:Uncharacterized protein n=1 Tax=Streblomastix strix TaxID=222440 RepID=A0A5J4UQP1_9EUKA|nr:MAG: hypothetical protein EZS28_032132 [Streblomastix strix]